MTTTEQIRDPVSRVRMLFRREGDNLIVIPALRLQEFVTESARAGQEGYEAERRVFVTKR